MDHSYMITAKLTKNKRHIVYGSALSLVALKRVLDFIDEYAGKALVSVHINTTMSKPLNTVRILTPEDYFDGTGKMRRAALIVLDREGYDGDEEGDPDSEGDEDLDDEEEDFIARGIYNDPFDDFGGR